MKAGLADPNNINKQKQMFNTKQFRGLNIFNKKYIKRKS